LLAIDTPTALKEHALPGLAWDIFAEPLLQSLIVLEECPTVWRSGLVSDHLRAITPPNVDAGVLLKYLDSAGMQNIDVKPVAPTLEDVFLALATQSD
jgi:hypothetical protein